MPAAESLQGGQEAVYPARCAGECHLGPKALALVDGVLSANCPEPKPFNVDAIVVVDTNNPTDDESVLAMPGEGDLDQRVCTNPRLVRAVREQATLEVDHFLVTSVKTGE